MLYNKVTSNIAGQCLSEVEYIDNGSVLVLKPKFYVETKAILSDMYGFSLSFQKNSPGLTIDGRNSEVPQNSIIAVNPGQVCECRPGTAEYYPDGKDAEYLAIFIQKSFFDGLSQEMFGKGDVAFYNYASFIEREFASFLNMFIDELKYKRPGYQFILDMMSNQIAVFILRKVANSLPDKLLDNTDREYKAEKDINRVIDFMHSNNMERACLEDLCGIAHLSPYYFIKVFKKQTGKTPYEYYIDIKLEKAAQLLGQKKYSITEVAYMTGFSSQSYFSALFKKKKGCTPLRYRNQFL